MNDQAPVAKDQLKVALAKLVDERASEAFLARLSEPGIRDYFIHLVGTAFDRIERKSKQGSSIRA